MARVTYAYFRQDNMDNFNSDLKLSDVSTPDGKSSAIVNVESLDNEQECGISLLDKKSSSVRNLNFISCNDNAFDGIPSYASLNPISYLPSNTDPLNVKCDLELQRRLLTHSIQYSNLKNNDNEIFDGYFIDTKGSFLDSNNNEIKQEIYESAEKTEKLNNKIKRMKLFSENDSKGESDQLSYIPRKSKLSQAREDVMKEISLQNSYKRTVFQDKLLDVMKKLKDLQCLTKSFKSGQKITGVENRVSELEKAILFTSSNAIKLSKKYRKPKRLL